MCRYDGDECEWYVDSQNDEAVSDIILTCEDCFRKIHPGEIHTCFTSMPGSDYDGDEPQFIFVAQAERDTIEHVRPEGMRNWKTMDHDKPWFRIEEESSEIWEYFGYHVFEHENPDVEMPDHISCAQCVKANKWLTVICQQHVVMVTKEDLNEHLREYDEEILGPDFVLLVEAVNREWKHEGLSDVVMTTQWVEYRTQRAIDHAIAKGLQEMAHA